MEITMEQVIWFIGFIGLPSIITGMVAFLIKRSPRIDIRLKSKEHSELKSLFDVEMHSLDKKIMLVKRIKGGEVRYPRYYFHFHREDGTIEKHHINDFHFQDIEGNIGEGLEIPLTFVGKDMRLYDKIAIIMFYSHPDFPIRHKVIVTYPLKNGLIQYKKRKSYATFTGFLYKQNLKEGIELEVFSGRTHKSNNY